MTLWKSVYQFRETATVNCENPGKNRQDRPILLGERSSVGIRASCPGTRVAADLRRLLALDLGRFPELGGVIDPGEDGMTRP
jgi:hypothetical protein